MRSFTPTPQRKIEDWFRGRGLSSFLTGTEYRSDVSRRAAPFLVLWFVVAMSIAAAATGAYLALPALLITWFGANLLRRRPFYAMVDRIGWPERVAFVFVPVIASLLTAPNGVIVGLIEEATDEPGLKLSPEQVDKLAVLIEASCWAIGQMSVLILALSFVGLGIFAVTRWLWREIWHSLEHAGTALARALPLLVIITIFSFWTAEIWQSVGRLRWPGTIGVIALFTVIGGAFIMRAQTGDLREMATFADRKQLMTWLKGTPLERAAVPASVPLFCELTPKQRRSAKFVMTVSKLVLSSVIGLFTACFFVILGFITISQADVAAFTTSTPEVLWGFTLDERRFVISWQLIRVAGFMGIFSAFYFAVVSATDEQLREHMLEAAEDGVRQACAARIVILNATSLDSDHDGIPDVDDPDVVPVAPTDTDGK